MPDGMRARAIDLDLLEDGEAPIGIRDELGANARFMLLSIPWILPQELVAGKAKDLQPARPELLVELRQLGVPPRGLASCAGHVYDKHSLAAQIPERILFALGRFCFKVVEVVRKVRNGPALSVRC